jgi:hypothetical protein
MVVKKKETEKIKEAISKKDSDKAEDVDPDKDYTLTDLPGECGSS